MDDRTKKEWTELISWAVFKGGIALVLLNFAIISVVAGIGAA